MALSQPGKNLFQMLQQCAAKTMVPAFEQKLVASRVHAGSAIVSAGPFSLSVALSQRKVSGTWRYEHSGVQRGSLPGGNARLLQLAL
jgi:hypothetical protein